MPNAIISPRTNFTQIDNALLEDSSTSANAKVLHFFALSKPKDWNFSFSYLQKALNFGKDRLRAAISELEENGYLHRIKPKKRGGRFMQSNFLFSNQRHTPEQYEQMVSSTYQSYRAGKPATAVPENQPRYKPDKQPHYTEEKPRQEAKDSKKDNHDWKSATTKTISSSKIKKTNTKADDASHRRRLSSSSSKGEIVGLLRSMKFSEREIGKIFSLNSFDDIEFATSQAFATKSPRSLKAIFYYILNNPNLWDVKEGFLDEEKLKEVMRVYEDMDLNEMGTRICVGNSYIEFVTGAFAKVFLYSSTKSYDFIKYIRDIGLYDTLSPALSRVQGIKHVL